MTKNSTTWNSVSGTWQHGKTTVIRVPIALVSEIVAYARAIDAPDAHNIPKQNGNVFFQQQVILQALALYVEWKQQNYHPNQNARKLNTNTRAWDELRRFQKMVEKEPELLLPSK